MTAQPRTKLSTKYLNDDLTNEWEAWFLCNAG